MTDGPWGLAYLRPQALFGIDLPPLVHGVLLSLALNIACFIGCSFSRRPTAIERMQADLFVPSTLSPILASRSPNFGFRRASVTVDELVTTIARYLGDDRTRKSFENFAASRRLSLDPQAEADIQLLQHGEYLLASAIGASSSRLVLSLLIRKRTLSTKTALKLLDDANAAIHYNREILQTALDHVRQGIAVFDKELNLVCWNRQFGEILRPSARIDPRRHRDLTTFFVTWRSRARTMPRMPTGSSANASPSTRRKMSRSSNASPSADWWSKCERTACRMAAWSRRLPTSRRA